MSEVYKLGIFMKFDSLEAVLLGDEAWACELTMDELSFVGGGYGSGYGSAVPAPVSGQVTVGFSTYTPYDGYSAYRELPNSSGGSSGMYLSVSNTGVGYSLVDANTGKAMDITKDARGITHVSDNSSISTPGLTPDEARAICHKMGNILTTIAEFTPNKAAKAVAEATAAQFDAACTKAVDNLEKLYNKSNEAQNVVFHQQSYWYTPTSYYSNGSGGGSWGSGYGGASA
jgi:hypothetical protein